MVVKFSHDHYFQKTFSHGGRATCELEKVLNMDNNQPIVSTVRFDVFVIFQVGRYEHATIYWYSTHNAQAWVDQCRLDAQV